jgi:hypothetical protein
VCVCVCRYGGLGFNRAEFGRSRGVACSASEEFEYEESLQFVSDDTTSLFGDDGMSRDERGDRVQYGPDSSKWCVQNASRDTAT